MTPFRIPFDQIQKRLSNLQEHLRVNRLDGALIIQRVDLIYFSGTAQNGCLFVPAHDPPLLFIKRSHSRACQESPLKHVIRIQSINEVPGLIRDCYSDPPKKLGLELDVMPVNQFRFMESLFPGCCPVDASGLITAVFTACQLKYRNLRPSKHSN